MNINTRSLSALLLLCAAFNLAGCAHQLEVVNLDRYRGGGLGRIDPGLTIGFDSNAERNSDEFELVRSVAAELKSHVRQVQFPYHRNLAYVSNSPSSSDPDIVVDVELVSDYDGSLANFFLNFPGFLVWAPAWNGYVYKAGYDLTYTVKDTRTGRVSEKVRVPINYDIRHADISRTWMQIGWLEWGVIPLTTGFFYTQYDDNITHKVVNTVARRFGEHAADRIVETIDQMGIDSTQVTSAQPAAAGRADGRL